MRKIGFYLALVLLIPPPAFAQMNAMSARPVTTGEMDAFLPKQMQELGMPGLSIAVINHGRVVYNRALGVISLETKQPVDEQTVFEAASLSKPVFAWLVMRMVDQGRLNLDTPLYRYLPYPDIEQDGRYKLITARMALSHQTGFPNWRYFEMADPSLHIPYGQLYLKFTPGTSYAYSGEGYHYLAQVIAHLNGGDLKTLNDVFEREEAEPLGMEHAWFTGNSYLSAHMATGHKNGKVAYKAWPTSFPGQDSSTFGAAGGLHTDAISYAHFLTALMAGKVLTRKSQSEMLRQQVEVPRNDAAYVSGGDTGYALGFAIRESPYGRLYEHGGNNGNFQSGFVIDMKRKMGYVFFTNSDKGDAFNKKLSALMVDGKE
jgi:CubicO group peptidase (beta-lactamase class C family)